VATATPANYMASLSYDPALTRLAYSCTDATDATHAFTSPTPVLGATCVVGGAYAPSGTPGAVSALVTTGGHGAVDTARVLSASVRPASTAPAASRNSEQKQKDAARQQRQASQHESNQNQGRDQNHDQSHGSRASAAPPSSPGSSSSSGRPQGGKPPA
jgi:hypothetical protein